MHPHSRLVDHVIGEAALTILGQKKTISLASLLAELHIMATNSAVTFVQNACIDAISWIEEDYTSELQQADALSNTMGYVH